MRGMPFVQILTPIMQLKVYTTIRLHFNLCNFTSLPEPSDWRRLEAAASSKKIILYMYMLRRKRWGTTSVSVSLPLSRTCFQMYTMDASTMFMQDTVDWKTTHNWHTSFRQKTLVNKAWQSFSEMQRSYYGNYLHSVAFKYRFGSGLMFVWFLCEV